MQTAKAQNAGFEWVRNMGNNEFDQALGLTTDADGSVYVTGFFQGTTPFDPGTGATTLTSAGSSDAFLVKYDAAGNYQWVRGLGGSTNDQGNVVATDSKNNIYVAGQFSSTNFVPGGSTTSFTAIGWNDAFLVKYDAKGNFIRANHLESSSATYVNGITVDAHDNVYIVGNFSDSTDFNPGTGKAVLKAHGSGDIFLAKYDSNGNYIWAINMGGNDGSEGHGVAVDDNGNAYLTGFFNGSVDFDPGTGTPKILNSMGVSDIFLAKYDSNGHYLWANNMGSGSDDYGMGVDLDRNGNVYVTGFYNSSANFDLAGGSSKAVLMSVAGSRDGFVAKYDSAGTFLWVDNIGGTGYDESHALAVDRHGNVYVSGVYADTLDFDPLSSNASAKLTSEGLGDGYVVKYDPDGHYLWVKGMGGSGYELSYGVALDGSGNVFTCGYFLSAPADFNIGDTGGKVSPIGGSSADGFVVKFGCGDTSSSRLELSECGDSFTFNGVTYTQDGTYTQVLSSVGGCDSTVILELTLYKIEPEITIDKFKLGVTGHYATYQWIKDGKDINGATDSTYIVTENGVYQVRVTNENGCEGTSDEYPINNVSVDDLTGTGQQIYIYPNPAKDILYVNSPLNINISLNSIEGRRLVKVTNAKTTAIKTGNLTPGIYILRITDEEGRLIKVEKIRKQ